jgi:site-specific recombinase XerD
MGKLRERMRDELAIRGYSKKTATIYVDCMKRMAKFFMKSPDTYGPNHIFNYQSHLVKSNVSWCTFNQSVCAMRFFYNRVLKKKWLIEHIPFQKKDLFFLPY